MPASAVRHRIMTRPNHEDRRREPRLLCADLVTVYWLDDLGNPRKCIANLEDVSHCGACLLMDAAISPESEIRIDTGCGHYLGFIRYLAPFATSYMMGVQFLPGCEWEASTFEPAHLFDPGSLLPRDQSRESQVRETAGQPVPEANADDLQRLLAILRSDFAR